MKKGHNSGAHREGRSLRAQCGDMSMGTPGHERRQSDKPFFAVVGISVFPCRGRSCAAAGPMIAWRSVQRTPTKGNF